MSYRYRSEAYNKYYKKCRLVEQPQIKWDGKKNIYYEDTNKRILGWVPEQYAKEGNLLKVGLNWDITYIVLKVFPTKTTKKYIDKLQEPILC